MARRLVEAGVRFVTVALRRLRRLQLGLAPHTATTSRTTCCRPSTRRSPRCWTTSTSAGLLDETLVVALGEMGRTPQGNGRLGPRPLEHPLPRRARRRRHSRRHRPTAAPTRTPPIPSTIPSPPRDSPPRSTTRSASHPTSACRTTKAGRRPSCREGSESLGLLTGASRNRDRQAINARACPPLYPTIRS